MKKYNFAGAVFFGAVFLFSAFPQGVVLAVEQNPIVWTEQADFAQGTPSPEVDINAAPGDIKIKKNLNFESGQAGVDYYNSWQTKIVGGVNGDITLDQQNYHYNMESDPPIADENSPAVFLDNDNNLLFVGTTNGVSAIDTKGTGIQDDDENLFDYNSTTIPGIGVDEYYGLTVVNAISEDKSRGLLYFSTNNGLAVVDRNGTANPTDDTLVGNYTIGSIANFPGDLVTDVFIDSSKNLLYVSIYGGFAVINTQGTETLSDDAVERRYSTTSNPINIGSNTVNSSFVKDGVLYINVNGRGLVTIDTLDDDDPTNDVLLKEYTTATTPALTHGRVRDSFIDDSTGFLYVGSYESTGGVTIIDTKKTPKNAADDTLVGTYTKTTTPALLDNYIEKVILESNSGWLFVFASSTGLSTAAVTIIDTKKTNTLTDDVVVRNYTTETEIPLPGYIVNQHGFLVDPLRSLMYFGSDSGLAVINYEDLHYAPKGEFQSRVFDMNMVPNKAIIWDQTVGAGQNVSVSARTNTTENFMKMDFDDGETTEYAGDHYRWGNTFETAVENNGTLKLSNPNTYVSGNDSWVDFWIDTGMPDDYFPAGTIVEARVRANSDRSMASYTDFLMADDGYETGFWKNNTWVIIKSELTTEPFSKIGFDVDWRTGTWDDENDSFEIDWIYIYTPGSWSEWTSPCSNNYGCSLNNLVRGDFMQYKFTLETDDPLQTPSVNGVQLSSGFHSAATFISNEVPLTNPDLLTALVVDKEEPEGTAIDIGYSTDSGETWTELGDNRVNSIDLEGAETFQWKADFSTTNAEETPALESLILTNVANEGPTSEKFIEDISTGFVSIGGADPAQTDKVTFITEYMIISGDTQVIIPAGTEMTKTGGGVFDFSKMTVEDITQSLADSMYSDVAGAISIGIPNLRLSFSRPISITLPVDAAYNGQKLTIYYQNAGEAKWNKGTSCVVADGECVFETDHATKFSAGGDPAQQQKAHINSWKAYEYEKPDLKCVQRLKVEIEGKYFEKDAKVKIGGKEAFDVDRKSSKKIIAKFCMEKLLDVKTGLKRTLSVTNPDAEKETADKKINLGSITQKISTSSFDPGTIEGVRNIQKYLIKLGYLDPQYATGVYGPLTTEAVKKFQADNGISQTGWVGSLTASKLAEKAR